MVLCMVVIYLAAMILIGYVYKQKAGQDEESFLVADRSISTFIGGGALAATYTSTSGFLGLLGMSYVYGISPPIWGNIGLLIGFLIAMVFLAPQFRGTKVSTFPQYFEQRYDKRIRAIAAVVTLVTMIVYMIAQIQGGAYAFQSMIGVSYPYAVVIIGIVFIVYVALGGSYASIMTSFFQNIMMILAMGIVALYVVFTQDWGSMVSQAVQNNTALLDHWGSAGPVFALSFGLLLGLGTFSSPHVTIRFASAKNEEVAKKTTASAIFWLSIFYLLTLPVVMFIVANYTGLKNPDMGYFILIGDKFPKIIVGFCVASVLAAAMSTTSSQLIAAAASVTNDLHSVYFQRQLPRERVMKLTRWAVVIIGIITILLTLRPPALIALVMALAQSLMVGAFLVPLMLGIWWRKTTANAALAGMIAGFGVAALTHPSLHLVKLPSPFLVAPIGALVSLVIMIVVSLLEHGSSTSKSCKSA